MVSKQKFPRQLVGADELFALEQSNDRIEKLLPDGEDFGGVPLQASPVGLQGDLDMSPCGARVIGKPLHGPGRVRIATFLDQIQSTALDVFSDSEHPSK